jgi:hypothetical protein
MTFDMDQRHPILQLQRTLRRQFVAGMPSVMSAVPAAQAAEAIALPLRANEVGTLHAVMANEDTAHAQVYRVSSLRLAADRGVRDFEAVSLPGARKDILGVSVLRALAPFTVDVSSSARWPATRSGRSRPRSAKSGTACNWTNPHGVVLEV